MSVVSVEEDIMSRTGDIDWKYVRTYKRVYNVLTNADTDDAFVVLNASGIPNIVASYPSDLLALVQKKTANRVSQFFWKVSVDYGSHFDIDPLTLTENPLLRPPITTYSWEKSERAVREDLVGQPIVNSAGTPYNPPLSVEMGTKIIDITVNRAVLPFATTLDLEESVNSDTWVDPLGISYVPHTLCIRACKASQKWENNQLYFEVSWTLAYRSIIYDGWYPLKVLDEGYFTNPDYLTEGYAGMRIIRDVASGAPLPEPSLLDGEGDLLEAGEPPVYNSFLLRNAIAFTGLIP